jgi:hypothetical protein
LAFGDVPTIHMIIGGVIVVGSGIFIVWRERQLGLERARAKRFRRRNSCAKATPSPNRSSND